MGESGVGDGIQLAGVTQTGTVWTRWFATGRQLYLRIDAETKKATESLYDELAAFKGTAKLYRFWVWLTKWRTKR